MSTETIDKGGVAQLLAKSNALGNPEENQPAQSEPQVAETPTPVGNKPAITPEEAQKLAEQAENVEVTPSGEVLQKKETPSEPENKPENKPEEKEENTLQEPDLEGLTLEEQIEALTKYKEEKEKAENPLASVEAKVEEAGLKVDDLHKEYIEKGELSAESLDSLDKAGFDQTAIDAYIATKSAQADALAQKALTDVCGTPENFQEAINWFAENATPEEIEAYDKGVQSPNFKVHLENMYNKYQLAQPNSQRVVRNEGRKVATTANSNQGYTSTSEMVKAMSDPRYQRDLNYRREVQRKVSLMK